jgi:hypothetical protein
MPALVKEEAVLRSSGTFPFFNFNQRLARKMIDNSIRQVLVVVGQQISSATGVEPPGIMPVFVLLGVYQLP